ncbi:MAG: hypothetical protein KGS72_11495 [Cyanobacteria bacterium REEB67]|nr:hypothetical protein [Cyanobacteria bacterium REEB67]
MNATELIKKIHATYSQCRSYQDIADCALTVALPDIADMADLIVKTGTLKHEFKRDKIFDMRWEWQPGKAGASEHLDYTPNSFSAVLDADEETLDISQTQTLKANLLHGILSMETEEDIFLIKRLIFFGEAEFWLEDFIYEWTLDEQKLDGRALWHLKRVDKGHNDPEVEMLIDKDNYTLVNYSSDASKAFAQYVAADQSERQESLEILFGDDPKPAAVIQKYHFRDVKIG